MEILVQKSVRYILSGGVVACDIFLIGGQPCVWQYVTEEEGIKFSPKKCDKFFEWPLDYEHLSDK